jgi:hypothetical protein
MSGSNARAVELGQVESALGMALAKALDDSLAIRVGSAGVRSSDGDAMPEVNRWSRESLVDAVDLVLRAAIRRVWGRWRGSHLTLVLFGVVLVRPLGEDAGERPMRACQQRLRLLALSPVADRGHVERGLANPDHERRERG